MTDREKIDHIYRRVDKMRRIVGVLDVQLSAFQAWLKEERDSTFESMLGPGMSVRDWKKKCAENELSNLHPDFESILHPFRDLKAGQE